VPPLREDETSKFIRAHSDRSVALPRTLDAARRVIAELKLDILFYQDIGMELFTYFLAFSRLAPVQCLSFGHPDTTGIANMDYFISNDLFEPADAAQHYSERLFLLHDLGTLAYYYRPRLPDLLKEREEFGLPADANLYVCPQALFKFHPEFDAMLGGILRADPRGWLVLIRSKTSWWVELLVTRFRKAMPDVADRIVFLPPQDSPGFVNLLAVSDVMLDTIHFNGMNTSLEGFSVGKPIVTLPTEFQRGRHTAGMYRKMGFTECIAADPNDYVRIAVKLGTDEDYRRYAKDEILVRNEVLFEDMNAVREFERCFLEVVNAG
jgi:protein O-GlcNAc transferase